MLATSALQVCMQYFSFIFDETPRGLRHAVAANSIIQGSTRTGGRRSTRLSVTSWVTLSMWDVCLFKVSHLQTIFLRGGRGVLEGVLLPYVVIWGGVSEYKGPCT